MKNDDANKKVKKLKLSKETLRNLSNTELKHVAGGGPSEPRCGSEADYTCPTEKR